MPATKLRRRDAIVGAAALIAGSLADADAQAARSFTVSAPALGGYSADTLHSQAQNRAGVAFANSNWTTSSSVYFAAADSNQFVLSSRSIARDQEVETWTRRGYVFLRVSEGRALFFSLNSESPNATLTIGVCTGLTEGAYYPAASYVLYDNENLVNTVPGFRRTDTDRQRFTFGVAGFDIYCKFNGAEFLRIQDFHHIAAGGVALKCPIGYGYRRTTVRLLADTPLYSTPDTSLYDPRDFGFRAISTTGTITAGDNILKLASPTSLRLGDVVIVEIPDTLGRGNRGVGGSWPAQSYPTRGAMRADTLQAENTYAWNEDTGDVHQWRERTWVELPSYEYYVAKAIPRALRARVIAISANEVMLDRRAQATAIEAPVYLDVSPILNFLGQVRSRGSLIEALAPANMQVVLPEGDYAVAGVIYLPRLRNFTLRGAGMTKTRLFSPRGARSASIMINGDNNVVSDLHLQGNARDRGFGLNWASTDISTGYGADGLSILSYLDASSAPVTETTIPQGSAYPFGILMHRATSSVVQDCIVSDVFQKAVGASYCVNCRAYRVQNQMNDGLRRYIQWQLLWSDCTGGGAEDCSVSSPTSLLAGFSTFRSRDISFVRLNGLNATFASNTSGGFLFQDISCRVTDMSQAPDRAFSQNNPIVNVNSNIGTSSGAGLELVELGGAIINAVIVQEGYVNADRDLLTAISVVAVCPNIRISGGRISAPDYVERGRAYVAAVLSQGANTQVNDLIVTGRSAYSVLGGHNPRSIDLKGDQSSAIGCTADTISVRH